MRSLIFRNLDNYDKKQHRNELLKIFLLDYKRKMYISAHYASEDLKCGPTNRPVEFNRVFFLRTLNTLTVTQNLNEITPQTHLEGSHSHSRAQCVSGLVWVRTGLPALGLGVANSAQMSGAVGSGRKIKEQIQNRSEGG